MLIVRKLDFDWEHLLCELSEPLRAEVSLQRCHAFLMNQKLRGLLGAGESSTHPQFIKVLVTKMVQVVFSPGDFCIEEGDQGQEVYFLSRGTVVVVVCKRQVATLVAGDCFGEIALLVPGCKRTASIVAADFCEAHKLERVDFEHCLDLVPELKEHISVLAAQRLQELNKVSSKNGLSATGCRWPAQQQPSESMGGAPSMRRDRPLRHSFSSIIRAAVVSDANNKFVLPTASAFAYAAAEATQLSAAASSAASSITSPAPSANSSRTTSRPESRSGSRRPSADGLSLLLARPSVSPLPSDDASRLSSRRPSGVDAKLGIDSGIESTVCAPLESSCETCESSHLAVLAALASSRGDERSSTFGLSQEKSRQIIMGGDGRRGSLGNLTNKTASPKPSSDASADAKASSMAAAAGLAWLQLQQPHQGSRPAPADAEALIVTDALCEGISTEGLPQSPPIVQGNVPSPDLTPNMVASPSTPTLVMPRQSDEPDPSSSTAQPSSLEVQSGTVFPSAACATNSTAIRNSTDPPPSSSATRAAPPVRYVM